MEIHWEKRTMAINEVKPTESISQNHLTFPEYDSSAKVNPSFT